MASADRHSRLLNLQKSPASNIARQFILTICRSATQNATTSPFLKLPPEIRQRIYGYALGGRILHVASGPMLGANRVVICVNSDDFMNGVDRQMIHGIRDGMVEVKNRGVTYSQLESHKKCHEAHAAWSLNLLGVCRQIYHEAVLVPFKKNAFAVVDGITPESARTLSANFLNRLVPAQAKAIAHLILQGRRICGTRRPTLARLKGLHLLEFILSVEDRYYGAPDSWSDYCEDRFTDRKLGKLGLPPLCDVNIKVREYVEWPIGDPPGDTQVSDGMTEWAKNVESRVKS